MHQTCRCRCPGASATLPESKYMVKNSELILSSPSQRAMDAEGSCPSQQWLSPAAARHGLPCRARHRSGKCQCVLATTRKTRDHAPGLRAQNVLESSQLHGGTGFSIWGGRCTASIPATPARLKSRFMKGPWSDLETLHEEMRSPATTRFHVGLCSTRPMALGEEGSSLHPPRGAVYAGCR